MNLFVLLLIATSILTHHPAQAQDTVRVQVLVGSPALALWAGLEQGFFQARGLSIDASYANTAADLRNSIFLGDADLAYADCDNSVAIGPDSVILSGGDWNLHEFIVQSEVQNLADMKDRTLIVDLLSSAVASQAYQALKLAGVNPGEYLVEPVGNVIDRYNAMLNDISLAASPLVPPFSYSAVAQNGLKSLGRMNDFIGTYQSNSIFARRRWLEQEPSNEDIVIRFIAAWMDAVRWVLDPDNREAVLAILSDELGLGEAPNILEQTYQSFVTPGVGLQPNLEFSKIGFANVLAIRQEFQGSGPFVINDFVDFSYYESALESSLAQCSANEECAALGLSGACCPSLEGTELDCCTSAATARWSTMVSFSIGLLAEVCWFVL